MGAEAVIDKDSTTQLLSNSIGAQRMIVLTNVDYVYKDHKRMKGRIKKVSAVELATMIDHFEEGTMKPKLEACLEFLKGGGRVAQIGNLDKFERVMKMRSGTEIISL